MKKSEYQKYLQSDHWRELRQDFLSENELCYECNMPRWLSEIAYGQDLHVHHLKYANLFSDKWEDLEALCPRCHDIKTFGRSELRSPKTATCISCNQNHWNPRNDMCTACDGILGTPHLYWIRNNPHPYIAEITIGEFLKERILKERVV